MSTLTTNYGFELPTVGGDEDAWVAMQNAAFSSIDELLGGDENVDGIVMINATITTTAFTAGGNIRETVAALATAGTVDLDASNGTLQTLAMSGAVTLTDGLSSGEFVSLRVTGSSTLTWPPGIKWPGGVEPALDTSDENWFQIWKVGSTLYGALSGVFS